MPIQTAQVLSNNCTGPNPHCRRAARAGLRVHIMPTPLGRHEKALVMPTYHYATVADGVKAIEAAVASAPTVYNDQDLALYRQQHVPYFLPIGWVDPTRRRR